MKAVITNEGNSEQLTLKLVSEGANDRTLMSMLAKQYPAIRIQDRDSIEVPILSRDALVAESVDDLLIESDVEIVEGLRATVTLKFTLITRVIGTSSSSKSTEDQPTMKRSGCTREASPRSRSNASII